MSHSLSRVFIHAVWSTWQRTPWISIEIEDVIRRAIDTQLKRLACWFVAFGSFDDHVHVVFALDRSISIGDVIRSMKGASAHDVIRSGLTIFRWQTGYGAFSVDARDPEPILEYVRNQRARHAMDEVVSQLEVVR